MSSQDIPKMVNTPKKILKEAEDAIHNWKVVLDETKVPADDLFYYAKQLWSEDQKKWHEARHCVLTGKCTVEEFDEKLRALQKKQAPVWNIIDQKESALRSKIVMAHDRLKVVHADIHKAIQEDPLTKKYIQPLARVFGKPLHPDQKELLHFYETKLHRQLNDAEEAFMEICGFPSGALTLVQNMHAKALTEATNLQEVVHKKKGIAMPVVQV